MNGWMDRLTDQQAKSRAHDQKQKMTYKRFGQSARNKNKTKTKDTGSKTKIITPKFKTH